MRFHDILLLLKTRKCKKGDQRLSRATTVVSAEENKMRLRKKKTMEEE